MEGAGIRGGGAPLGGCPALWACTTTEPMAKPGTPALAASLCVTRGPDAANAAMAPITMTALMANWLVSL